MKNNPGVAVDGAGDVFVAVANNDPDPQWNCRWQEQTTVAITGLKILPAWRVDAAGDIVAVGGNSQSWNCPLRRTTVAITGCIILPPWRWTPPVMLFVNDTKDSNQVVELPFGGSQTTVAFTGLKTPFGIALDAGGDVFVADMGNNRVVEFVRWDQTTLAPANRARMVATAWGGCRGDVFVSDSANNQVSTAGGSQTSTGRVW